MPSLLPPDFLTRHDLVHRLSSAPFTQPHPAQPWAPLTNGEWAALSPILAAHGCGPAHAPRPGRPPVDTRARLDAIFRAVTLKRSPRRPRRLAAAAGGIRQAGHRLPHPSPLGACQSLGPAAGRGRRPRLPGAAAPRSPGGSAAPSAAPPGSWASAPSCSPGGSACSAPCRRPPPAAGSGFVRKPVAGAARAAASPGRPSRLAAAAGRPQGARRAAPALRRPPAGRPLDGTGMRLLQRETPLDFGPARRPVL